MTDKSTMVLLFANIAVIAIFMVFGLGFAQIVWIYWIESVAIGVFTALSMFMASIQSKGQGGLIAGLSMSGFFCFHYGLFHIAYLILISALGIWPHPGDFILLALSGGVLSLAHLYLFFENTLTRHGIERKSILSMKSVISQSMEAYRTIAPMNIVMILSIAALILGVQDAKVKIILILLLMGIKTAANLTRR
jgi:hypothetical protein